MKNLIVFFKGRNEPKSEKIIGRISNSVPSDELDVDISIFNDPTDKWYLKNINELIVKISDLIHGYSNVIFIGRSSGGYIAILLGSLLEVSNVIALCPQTFIDHLPERVALLQDKKEFLNLKNVINKNTSYNIYTKLDDDIKHGYQHYKNLEVFKNVNFIDCPYSDIFKNIFINILY